MFVPVPRVPHLFPTFLFQAYMALCCRKVWGEEWKGVKLTRLYILLREQFAHPDDPWCTETLEWWNEFRLFTRYLSFIHSQPPRKIFGGSTETDEDSQDVMWDTHGPSMRERMDSERRERMRAVTGN